MRKRFSAAILSLILASTASAQQKVPLTVERIFQNPSLDGVRVRNLQWSPDGRLIVYLRSDPARDVNDLWSFDPASAKSESLLLARDLVSGGQVFSREEEMVRERTRQTDIGITSYFWSPDGRSLYFPLNGDIYEFYPAGRKMKRLIETAANEFDPKISPAGSHMAYVREGDIYVRELASGTERRLTTGATDKIKNGISEFVAQEEMGRTTGYWWSPDGRQIAYLHIDDTPVQEFNIPNFLTPNTGVTVQVYPKAGHANTLVSVGVVPAAGGSSVFLDLGPNRDIYVARVDWLPGSEKLAVQIQSRNQDTLDLVVYDLLRGTHTRILRETDPRWVSLHDHLRFLKRGGQFIWSSERDGFRHLYLFDIKGKLINRVTQGDWEVLALAGVDERQRVIYFTATEHSPREVHLYRVRFDGSGLTRISERPGHHEITMSPDLRRYVDIFSDITRPPRVALMTAGRKGETSIETNPVDDLEKFALPAPELFTVRGASGDQLNAFIIRPPRWGTEGKTQGSAGSRTRTSITSSGVAERTPAVDAAPERRFPAIVYVYGGPTSQIVMNAWGAGGGMARSLWHRSMANHGYVVFGVDGRGTPGRGRPFQQMIHRRLGKVELDDELSAVAYLKTLPYVDTTRIMIWGKSYGGFMSCMAMLTTGNTFKLGIAVAPVTDWRNYDTHYTERYLERPGENPEGYELSSPITYASGLQNRLLIIHGAADDNVHFQDSMILADQLQNASKQFDFMVYPKSTHSFSGKITSTHLYSLLTRYIQENL